MAKHGNRSITSKSGSADVLEALGINLYLPAEKLAHVFDKVGLVFLFAQNSPPSDEILHASPQTTRNSNNYEFDWAANQSNST